jgi:hypothetical protein
MTLGLIWMWKRKARFAVYFLVSSLLPAYLLFLFYLYIDRQYAVRYSIFGSPGMILAHAHGIMLIATALPRFTGRTRMEWIVWTCIGVYGASCLVTHFSMRPRRRDWAAAGPHVFEHARIGDRVVVPSILEEPIFRYYMGRFNLDHLRLTTQHDQPGQGFHGNTWMVGFIGSENFRDTGFSGITVEKQTSGYPTTPVDEMISRLELPGTLHPGKMPAELVG